MSNEDPEVPPVQSPPVQGFTQPPQGYSQPPAPARPSNSVVDTLIPSKNPPALVSYYLGLFSIFPVFGIALGAVAMWLGRKGLIAIKETPGLSGKTHARVGIGCGLIGFLFNLGLILLLLGAILFGGKTAT